MPSRASKTAPAAKPKTQDRDFMTRARNVVEQAIGEQLNGEPLPVAPLDTRNPAAVALSKLGSSKGGKARAKNLSKARRLEIAKKAAKARWGG